MIFPPPNDPRHYPDRTRNGRHGMSIFQHTRRSQAFAISSQMARRESLTRREVLCGTFEASPGVRRCTRVTPLLTTPEDAQHHMSMTVHYRVSLSADSTTTGEGRLLDLSLEGCRIESPRHLPVNTYLSLRLQISPDDMPILVDLAAVRWTRGTNCGVHFLSVQPLQAARLQTFLASASPQKQPPAPGLD